MGKAVGSDYKSTHTLDMGKSTIPQIYSSQKRTFAKFTGLAFAPYIEITYIQYAGLSNIILGLCTLCNL